MHIIIAMELNSKTETTRILNLLNTIYEGDEPWHGPSVVEVLSGVSPKLAQARLSGNTHSIAEIVYHMTTWRIFAVKKLQGDVEFDVVDKEKNWKTFPYFDDFEWEALQMELSLSQNELVNALEGMEDDSYLQAIVPGREYDYYTLIHGLINHDIYHSGQVSMIKKGAKLRVNDEDLDDLEDNRNFEGINDLF